MYSDSKSCKIYRKPNSVLKKQGFTLFELVVVVIIVGILAALGLPQYNKVTEKGRGAEAKVVLGLINKAQMFYNQEYGGYTSNLTALSVSAPTSCVSTHHFYYSTDASVATATRCTDQGQPPQGSTAFNVTLTYSNGTWGGSTGYY